MQSPVLALEPALHLKMASVGAAPSFSDLSFKHRIVERPLGRVSKPAPTGKTRTLLILLQRLQLEGG